MRHATNILINDVKNKSDNRPSTSCNSQTALCLYAYIWMTVTNYVTRSRLCFTSFACIQRISWLVYSCLCSYELRRCLRWIIERMCHKMFYDFRWARRLCKIWLGHVWSNVKIKMIFWCLKSFKIRQTERKYQLMPLFTNV